jgi:alpha-ketoglutarate-dependent 2,4-dichlorophenoxyacetate dioxygenase
MAHSPSGPADYRATREQGQQFPKSGPTHAATGPGLSYVHIWRDGDVVMGDNRATMHRGRPWPAHEARLMVRTTISATKADGLQTVHLPSRQAAE